MGADPSKVAFRQVPWNAEAEALLASAVEHDAVYGVADMRREVEAGSSRLFAVIDYARGAPVRLGYVVAWIEPFGGTPEMVLQAGEALGNTIRAIPYVWPAIEAWARGQGALTIRVHVARGNRGRARALTALGMEAVETVYRKRV